MYKKVEFFNKILTLLLCTVLVACSAPIDDVVPEQDVINTTPDLIDNSTTVNESDILEPVQDEPVEDKPVQDEPVAPALITQEPIIKINHNRYWQTLEVSYKNPSNITGFFIQGQFITNTNTTLMQKSSVFVPLLNIRTVIFQLSETDKISEVIAKVDYGATVLNQNLTKTMIPTTIKFKDESDVVIQDVSYDQEKQRFVLKVNNKGKMLANVYAKLTDMNFEGKTAAVYSAHKSAGPENVYEIFIPSPQSTDTTVDVVIYFGQRPDYLLKTAQGNFIIN